MVDEIRRCGRRKVMRISRPLSWAGICAMLAGYAPCSKATDETRVEQLNPVEIVGVRQSVAGAAQQKRDRLAIVDSVVAAEIEKLPDFNVTDALSRITGVQILRDRGEGAGVAIRGLTQMETLLNGREVFTAGSGRNLDFADIPSEMLSAIDVYKTSSADLIEGGLGGSVDLRTHRPFDFAGRRTSASARLIHGDLVKRDQAQFSTLLSDRWQDASIGQFGALLNLAYQKRAWREDQKSAGNPIARADIVPGRTVFAPNGFTETTSTGYRERKSASAVFEWAPDENLQLYAEGHYAEFLTIQDSYQISAPASASFLPGSPVLFPGSNMLQGITWTNAAVTTAGAARDTQDRIMQAAAGGVLSAGALTLKSDVSYTRSHNNLSYAALTLSGTAAQLSQNLASGMPTSALGAMSFTNAGMWYAARPFDGDLYALKLDGEYQLDRAFIDTVSAGVRIAQRYATDAPGQVGFFPAQVAASRASGIVINNPYANYPVGDPSQARNLQGACNALGIACLIPASNPLGTWSIAEDTRSGYLMAKFKSAALDGDAGVRAVQTVESVSGYSGPAAGPFIPLSLNSQDRDFLPSLNLRYRLTEGFYLRGAASRSITRQDFSQLSPSLTLNPVQLTGTAGNPALKPIRADNFDLALERYFDATTFVHATGFLKNVDGFVSTLIGPESYNGTTYQVSRPYNSGAARIRGLELGYGQFYDSLPGWLKGLGLQANYTYVDSVSGNLAAGQSLPLQNLSRQSYNLIGMYQRGDIAGRIAYNWRDKFVSGIANIAGLGNVPVYTRAYGWLDASLSLRVERDLTLAIEGMNLLRTVRSSYYGVESMPQSSWINDRQLAVTATVSF